MATSKSAAGSVKAETATTKGDAVGEGKEAKATVGAAVVVGTERTVKLSEVTVKPGWNARRFFDPAELAALGQSLRELGQLASIVVCALAGGGFWLVAGEKRYRAARAVGLATLRAVVIKEADALAATWAENSARSDISHADRCRWLMDREAEGMTVEALAAVIKKDTTTVQNDIGIAKKLHPEIWAAWSRMPGHSKIALRIYGKDHETQLRLWAEYLGELRAKDAAKAAGTKGPRKLAGAPSKKDLQATYEELTRVGDFCHGREPAEVTAFLEGALWALEYVAGRQTDASDLMPAYPASVADARRRMHEPAKQTTLFDGPAKAAPKGKAAAKVTSVKP